MQSQPDIVLGAVVRGRRQIGRGDGCNHVLNDRGLSIGIAKLPAVGRNGAVMRRHSCNSGRNLLLAWPERRNCCSRWRCALLCGARLGTSSANIRSSALSSASLRAPSTADSSPRDEHTTPRSEDRLAPSRWRNGSATPSLTAEMPPPITTSSGSTVITMGVRPWHMSSASAFDAGARLRITS